MTRTVPLISVGMPVYNGEKYLASAIESVMAQTMGDFELLIADNASVDGTEGICRDYASRDRRIVYLRNPVNVGAAGNYNLLFQRSKAEYFRWFNADDLSSPRLHERCYEALREYPDASMAYGKTDIIDGEGQLIEHYEDRLDLRQPSAYQRLAEFFRVAGQTNVIYGLMRRKALGRTQLMGAGTFPAADTNLMGELVMQGQVIEVAETLFYRRMHEQASSWNRKDVAVQQQFWQGRNAKFTMPTFKRELAYWRAIDQCDAGLVERMRMKRLVLRRLIWSRDDIFSEAGYAWNSRTRASG